MQVRVINSMMHERSTRKWFCYNFIITIIGMMLGTIVVVVVARLTIDRFTTDVASINDVVIVCTVQRDNRRVGMQRMVMVVIIDDERRILLDQVLLYIRPKILWLNKF